MLALLVYAPYCLLPWRTHGAHAMVLDSGLSTLFVLTVATSLFRRSLNRSRDPHHRIFWDPSLVPITSRRRPHSADSGCTAHGHVSKSHIHTNGNHISAIEHQRESIPLSGLCKLQSANPFYLNSRRPYLPRHRITSLDSRSSREHARTR